jgi:hypothetical protein
VVKTRTRDFFNHKIEGACGTINGAIAFFVMHMCRRKPNGMHSAIFGDMHPRPLVSDVARATSTIDKIDVMLRLEQVASSDPEKNLTSGALTFYKKNIQKVKHCLDCHFTSE